MKYFLLAGFAIGCFISSLFILHRTKQEARIKEQSFKDSITVLKKNNALQRDSLIDEINYLKFRHPK